MRWDGSVHKREFLWKNSQAELWSGTVDMEDQSWTEMAAYSSCQSASVKCQTRRHCGGSLRIARKMLTFTRIWSDESIGAEEEQDTFAEKFVMTKTRREDLPFWEIQVDRSQIEFIWWSHRSPLQNCHGWWERYQHPAKLRDDNCNCHPWGRERVWMNG